MKARVRMIAKRVLLTPFYHADFEVTREEKVKRQNRNTDADGFEE